MNILVCIKPDVTGEEIGPFEHLALEAGLCVKEVCLESGLTARVDVVTAGPAHWQDCLVRALGTGADRGIHIKLPSIADSSESNLLPASAVAGLLSQAVCPQDISSQEISPQDMSSQDMSPQAYDLILTGVMSQDLMAGQTGPMLAHLLDIPCVTAAVDLSLSKTDRTLVVNREMDGGKQERLRLCLPALVSVQSGRYTPRYPVLSHMLKARQKPVQTIDVQSLPQSPEVFCPPVAPEQTRAGTIVSGTLENQVEAFTLFLRERGLA